MGKSSEKNFFVNYKIMIIGLSWSSADDGGICEARRYFIRIYENFNVQKLKSYNTGVVTYKFYGEMVKPKIAEIAFLRQVGTAFGAPVSFFLLICPVANRYVANGYIAETHLDSPTDTPC